MPEERFEERTEPATPRRRREARERGHVARSADVSAAAVLLAGVLALEFFGARFVGGFSTALTGVLGGLGEAGREGADLPFGAAFRAVAFGALPLLVAVVVAGLAANLVQVGFLLTAKPLVPSMERLDPFQGFQRLFSGRSMARLLFGLLKAGAVAGTTILTLGSERARLLGLSGLEFEPMLAGSAELILLLSLRVVLALLAIAVLDYAYQRWQYERDLRMSRREVREELKRYEGDPQVKDRRRALLKRLAVGRMMDRVPRAAVVVTNPENLAVALEYDERTMQAPVVSAKGAELLARRIREVALESGVPVIERPDLARALYRAEVGAAVPREHFDGVAELLAFAYRLRHAAA